MRKHPSPFAQTRLECSPNSPHPSTPLISDKFCQPCRKFFSPRFPARLLSSKKSEKILFFRTRAAGRCFRSAALLCASTGTPLSSEARREFTPAAFFLAHRSILSNNSSRRRSPFFREACTFFPRRFSEKSFRCILTSLQKSRATRQSRLEER